MNVLVINAGSSSFKYQLIDMDRHHVLCGGLVERIGEAMGRMVHKIAPDSDAEEKITTERPFANHVEGMKAVVAAITDPQKGVIKSKDEVHAIGHRVVMGGEAIKESVIIDDRIKELIRDNFHLSPLHNPANLAGIEVAEELFPGVPNVGVFDTEFHQTMPEAAYLYPLPYSVYTEYRVRRYGFHGTSHRYIAHRFGEMKGGLEGKRIINCHLGNGSSLAAIQDGKVVDTSMGFTPLDGFLMGTRCGGIDPSVVTYVMNKEGFSPDEMSHLMNKKSGFLGIGARPAKVRITYGLEEVVAPKPPVQPIKPVKVEKPVEKAEKPERPVRPANPEKPAAPKAEPEDPARPPKAQRPKPPRQPPAPAEREEAPAAPRPRPPTRRPSRSRPSSRGS